MILKEKGEQRVIPHYHSAHIHALYSPSAHTTIHIPLFSIYPNNSPCLVVTGKFSKKNLWVI
jgi:hypothetical protein